jgi:hypothetical protein
MRHTDFSIGLEFWCGGKRWRCTDVGTRVVVAICLEPRETMRLELDSPHKAKRTETRIISDDPKDLIGPPYGVEETVFEEYDVGGCTLELEADRE